MEAMNGWMDGSTEIYKRCSRVYTYALFFIMNQWILCLHREARKTRNLSKIYQNDEVFWLSIYGRGNQHTHMLSNSQKKVGGENSFLRRALSTPCSLYICNLKFHTNQTVAVLVQWITLVKIGSRDALEPFKFWQ